MDVKSTSERIAQGKKSKAKTEKQTFVMEGHEKADELAKERADADGGQMADAKALTIQQMRNELHELIEFATYFHAHI